MKSACRYLTVILAVATANLSFGADMVFRPVGATATYAIEGTQITISPGAQRVFLEHKIYDFGPDFITAYQGKIDPDSFTSGVAGVLTPAHVTCPSEGPAGNISCRSEMSDFGVGTSQCVSDYLPGRDLVCEPVWINRSQPDGLFYDHQAISVVDMHMPFRWGTASFHGEETYDEGFEYYAGDLAIDVPENARGTFSIRFVQAESFLNYWVDDSSFYIYPVYYLPARIVISCLEEADCNDKNPCTQDECRVDGVCNHVPACMPVYFTDCMTGPAIPAYEHCDPNDGNADGAVDLHDLADHMIGK